MRARRTSERGPGCHGALARSRRPGHRSGASRPGDVPHRVQVEPRLGPVRRGGARARRTPALFPPRPRDRRLELDQRDDLPAGQPRGLRRVGRAGLHRLVVRRGAAVLQALRGQRARRERVPRRGRPPGRVREPLDAPVHRRTARGRGRGGLRADRRPQRRPARGRVALPAHPAQRHALQRCRCVPPPGRVETQPGGDVRRLRRADRLRGRPRRRRRDGHATACARPCEPSAR